MNDEIKKARQDAQDALLKLHMLENPSAKIDILAFPIGKKVTVFWPPDQRKKTKTILITGYSIVQEYNLHIEFELTSTGQRHIDDMIDIIVDEESAS